jgi:hypothetical protein
MSSSRNPLYAWPRPYFSLPRLRILIGVASVALLIGSALTARPARAATLPDVSVRDQQQYVLTMGVVASVGRDTVTLRFEDGQTESYRITGATMFQTETGGAATAADLDVGDMVMVITQENASTAITIVNAGDRGFDAGGPFDIGPDEGV